MPRLLQPLGAIVGAPKTEHDGSGVTPHKQIFSADRPGPSELPERAIRSRSMRTPDQMLSEAVAAERLAAVVSYGPDKARLLAQAERLRAQARVAEERSFAPPDVRSRR